METHSCLTFAVDCGTLWKGAGVVIAGFILFVGSVYVLLAAIFGRWMGYLVLAVAFFGWMTIQSSLWLFGFWSQGPTTPTNLGPRGPDPAWVVDSAGLDPGAAHAELASYPSGEYPEPDLSDPLQAADVQAAQGVIQVYLANAANAEQGLDPTAFDSIQPTSFLIDDIRFTTGADGERLAVAQAHYAGGGPSTTVTLHYDDQKFLSCGICGSFTNTARYSWMFLIASVILLVLHIPALDRAERTRKEFLVGGSAPPWYGPA
jgi:hypothetical protein